METVRLLVKFGVIKVPLLKIRVFWNVMMCSRMCGRHCSRTAWPWSWRSKDPSKCWEPLIRWCVAPE